MGGLKVISGKEMGGETGGRQIGSRKKKRKVIFQRTTRVESNDGWGRENGSEKRSEEISGKQPEKRGVCSYGPGKITIFPDV